MQFIYKISYKVSLGAKIEPTQSIFIISFNSIYFCPLGSLFLPLEKKYLMTANSTFYSLFSIFPKMFQLVCWNFEIINFTYRLQFICFIFVLFFSEVETRIHSLPIFCILYLRIKDKEMLCWGWCYSIWDLLKMLSSNYPGGGDKTWFWYYAESTPWTADIHLGRISFI